MGYRCSLTLVIFFCCGLPLGSCDLNDDGVDPDNSKPSATSITSPHGSGRYLAVVGEDVKLSCRAFGSPTPFTIWYKDGRRISSHGNVRIRIQKKALTISRTEFDDSGNYSCHAHNKHGESSINITLLVQNQTAADEMMSDDEEKDYPDNTQVLSAGKENLYWDVEKANFVRRKIGYLTSYIELECPARGLPRPTIVWFKDGERIREQKSGWITVNKWKLTIADLILQDAGNYTCVVSNTHGNLTWAYDLEILQRTAHAPLIEQPQNQTVRVGETAVFSCRIELSDTHPHIQWIKHHQVKGSYINDNGEQNIQVVQTATVNNSNPEILILQNVTSDDEARYTCIVRNAVGSSYKSAYLEVQEDHELTTMAATESWINSTLLVQNQTAADEMMSDDEEKDYPDNTQVLSAGKENLYWDVEKANFVRRKIGYLTSYIKLECPARGLPRPTIVWFKDGERIREQKSGRITVNKWKLTIADLILQDAGNYTCVVSNTHGNLTWTYDLEIFQRTPHAPLIEQPQNQTVRVGETAVFSCRIELSDTHPHIQWIKLHRVNGSYTNDNGEQNIQVVQTATVNSNPEILILQNVTSDDEARYTCIVRNAVGSSYKSAYLEVQEDHEMTTMAATFIVKEKDITVILIVVAVIMVLFAVLSLGFYFHCRSVKKKQVQKKRICKKLPLLPIPCGVGQEGSSSLRN